MSNLLYLELDGNLLDLSAGSDSLTVINNLIADFNTVVFYRTQEFDEDDDEFLIATDGTFSDKVQIAWVGVAGLDVTDNLYRNIVPERENAVLLKADLDTKVYDDMTALPDITYYYWIESGSLGDVLGVSRIDSGYLSRSTDTIGVWGNDESGQATISAGLTDLVQVVAGDEHSVGLRSDGTVEVLGSDSFGQLQVPENLSQVISVAAGYFHTLALKEDSTVVAWGGNTFGQSIVPAGLSDVIQVAGGGDFSLALKADGTVEAWGNDIFGQTVLPMGLEDVVKIAAGGSHALALIEGGTVVAWGYNVEGQATVPVGLSNVVAIAAGKAHSLALKEDSTIIAWGSNDRGQLDIPIVFNSPSKQGYTAQFNASSVFSIAAGIRHNLALDSEGSIIAWGDNSDSQATIPEGFSNIAEITAGGRHNFVLFESTVVDLILDGSGDIAGENIQHPNGNIFDQVLLTGESIQLQAKENRITRVSFMDEDEDIVQVEFFGAGTFTLTLDAATFLPAALPPRYNQQVMYVTGKPSVVIDGADSSTFFSIFTVGRINAVNQALFPEGQVYDAQADVTLVEVINSTGIGGMQLSNTVFSGSTGKVGVDARGVPIAVRITVGDIEASGDAVPHLLFGDGSFTVPAGNPGLRITGGDLAQTNDSSIVVAESGSTTPGFETLIAQNNFKSDNTPQPTQSISATFANEDGDDITVTVDEITIE